MGYRVSHPPRLALPSGDSREGAIGWPRLTGIPREPRAVQVQLEGHVWRTGQSTNESGSSLTQP
jgi:hypothetical protein